MWHCNLCASLESLCLFTDGDKTAFYFNLHVAVHTVVFSSLFKGENGDGCRIYRISILLSVEPLRKRKIRYLPSLLCRYCSVVDRRIGFYHEARLQPFMHTMQERLSIMQQNPPILCLTVMP